MRDVVIVGVALFGEAAGSLLLRSRVTKRGEGATDATPAPKPTDGYALFRLFSTFFSFSMLVWIFVVSCLFDWQVFQHRGWLAGLRASFMGACWTSVIMLCGLAAMLGAGLAIVYLVLPIARLMRLNGLFGSETPLGLEQPNDSR